MKRLRQLVDEERSQELVKELEKDNENELEEIIREIEKVESEVGEAKRFKVVEKEL